MAQYTKSPSPSYGYSSPSPLYGSPIPSPVYDTPIPSPVYAVPSPSPKDGSPSPSPVYGSPSPSPVYGSPSPSPVYGSPSPSPVYTPPPVYYDSPSPKDGYGHNSPSPKEGYGNYSPPKDGYGHDSPSPKEGYGYNSPSPKEGYGYNSPSPKEGYGYNSPSPKEGYGSQSPPTQQPPYGQSPPKGDYPTYSPLPTGCEISPAQPGDSTYPGGKPTNPETSPSYPGTSPSYPGTSPSYPGTSPSYPGTSPTQPGDGSEQPEDGSGPQNPPTNANYPGIYNNPDTKYRLPDSPQQCKSQCVRKSVKQWTDEDWDLYGKLFLEMNKRGYLPDFVAAHQLDGQPLDFHGDKAFLPWHRLFITHFEQLMQKVDHEINPGRSAEKGEFCLGFWDWGYQEEFNNNLMDKAYEYVFNGKAIGTLINGPNAIPDSQFKDLTIAGPGLVQRDPSPGSNGWAPSAIATCINFDNFQEMGDEQGFAACLESLHGLVHTAVGQTMGSISVSPADPAFYLHHTMIDYLWWVWQQQSGEKTYGENFNAEMPQPYDQWVLDDAKDYNRLCFNYEGQRAVAKRSDVSASTGVATDFASLSQSQKDSVSKVLAAGPPKVLPKDKFTFLRSAYKSEEAFERMYYKYVRYVYEQQIQYDIVFLTFQQTIKVETNITIVESTLDAVDVINSRPKPVIGTPPSIGIATPPPTYSGYIASPPVAYKQNFAASASTSSPSNKNLAKYLNALTGSSSN